MMRAFFHPAHRPVVARREPALELKPGGIRRVGAREAARREAQAARFRPYCFLKALASIHETHLHRWP
jgi:hypothetical protein